MKNFTVFAIILALVAVAFAWAGPSRHGVGQRTRWQYKWITRNDAMPKVGPGDGAGTKEQQATVLKLLKDAETSAAKSEKAWNEELESAGQEGWELVTVTNTHIDGPGFDLYAITAYLKRAEQNQEV